MYIVLCFSMFFWKIIALPHQEHFAQSVSPNAMTGMADSGVVMIAICFILLPQWCFSQMCGMDLAGLKWGVVTPDALRAGLLHFFFERLLHSWCVSCMQRSAHIWVFSSAPFFLLCSFCYVCACMTFITCMIMHCVFLLTLAVQNLFASHSWNMHAYMHACMHACIINIMHVARGYLAQTCVVIWLILSRHHFWLPHGPTRMESRKEPCSIPSSRFPRTTRSNGVGYPVVV